MTTQDLKQMSQLLDQKLKAVEKGIDNKLVNLEKRVSSQITQLSSDIGLFMEKRLFPMLDEKTDKSDIERLEKRLDLFYDKTSSRLTAIESTPTIAHELKAKKH